MAFCLAKFLVIPALLRVSTMKYRQLFAIVFCIFFICSCGKNPLKYDGYIDTDLIYLSSDFAGRLTEILTKRGESVQKNQLLFRLEQTGEDLDIAMSQLNHKSLLAQRKQLLDQLNYDEINYNRTLRVRTKNAASQNDLDVAKKELDVLKNKLAALDFQIKSSQKNTANKQWHALRKESYAPESGIIFDTYYTKDEYVQAGQPVVSLLTKSKIKVVFFVPEVALTKIALNQKIKISSDGNPHLAIGKINYISNVAQYTPPNIYSREQREKLVFRIEASIDSPSLNDIHLGQPISLEVVQ